MIGPLTVTTIQKDMAACEVCGRVYKLRADGEFRAHFRQDGGWRGIITKAYCKGGKQPSE